MQWSNVVEMDGIRFSVFDVLRMIFESCSFLLAYLHRFLRLQKKIQRCIFKFELATAPAREVVQRLPRGRTHQIVFGRLLSFYKSAKPYKFAKFLL